MGRPTGNRAVVIGGGVVGVTTAVALASRGLQVTLVERSPVLASGATSRNGGQLSYSYADALGSSALWRELPRLLARLDPAFRIHPSLNPSFVSWCMRFLRNCTSVRFLDNTRAVLSLALYSRAALGGIRGRYPQLCFQHSASGKIHIYDNVEKYEAAKRAMPLKSMLGCEQRVLQLDELPAIEPALATCRRSIVGAIYSPMDEAGDSSLFTQQLADLGRVQHDLSVLTGTSVKQFAIEARRIRAIETSQGRIEGDLFVLAAGGGTAALARSLNIRLPIYPMKGYSVTLPAGPVSPTVSITDAGAKIVFCRLQHRLRVAGVAELGRADISIDPHRIEMLLTAAKICLPAAAEWQADPQPWCGLRPMTPDCRPIIGETAIPNLFVNCGHGMLGWTLACGSAELLTSVVLNESPVEDLRAMREDFALARF